MKLYVEKAVGASTKKPYVVLGVETEAENCFHLTYDRLKICSIADCSPSFLDGLAVGERMYI